jgi:hypothetical protein
MGQLTTDTWLGSYLMETCEKDSEVRTVVEIGTWDGMGSTNAIISGLQKSRKTDIRFVSLETNSSFYASACRSWQGKLPPWASLVHGRIIEQEDMDSSDLNGDEPKWFKEDMDAMSTCPNVLDLIPNSIDLLLLDGGEFGTKSEFLKLESRSKLIVLDDTLAKKCRWIREHVLSSPNKYSVVFDIPKIRNGVMAFRRSNK